MSPRRTEIWKKVERLRGLAANATTPAVILKRETRRLMDDVDQLRHPVTLKANVLGDRWSQL